MDAAHIEALCQEALRNPDSLKDWPEELLEGEHYAGCLARLIGWTRLQEAIEQAPPAQPLGPWLEMSQRQADWLEGRVPARLEAWFFREKARLVGFQNGDSLPWLRRSLHSASAYGQLEELEKTRAFLETEPQPCPSSRPQLERLLRAAAGMVEATQPDELARHTVQAVHDLLPVSAALWLEKAAGWEARAWFPLQVTPRFSQSVLERCLESQELTWGGPQQLEASRSVLLSKVRCLLALPLGGTHVLFLWQSEDEEWLGNEQLEVLQFLAKLASLLHGNLHLTRLAQAELEAAQSTHARWEALFEQSEQVAIAELDAAGKVLRANPAYQRLPQLPQLPRTQATRLIRLGEGPQTRWYQLSQWKVPEETGSYRALVDVSEREIPAWFAYLEELRQKLAADLHDGPAQLAVVLQMLEGSPRTQDLYQEIRNRLDWLRSPWLENQEPTDWLRQLVERRFLQVEWRQTGTLEKLSDSQAQTAIRLVIHCLEQLERLPDITRLEMEWSLSPCLRWHPELPVELPPTAYEAICARLEILKARFILEPGRAQIYFSN
jgi:PAS domain-containing protein